MSGDQKRLPFYLVCDVSYSMADENRIGAVNQAIIDIKNTLNDQPLLSDLAHFGVISFSDDARIEIPLQDMSEVTLPEGPLLTVRGGTNFAAAFDLLRPTIDSDVSRLKQAYRVFRPTVFFLSDGLPTSEWETSFAALTQYDKETRVGFANYPTIIPFGFGEANADVLRQLIHPRERSALYMQREGATASKAIREMTEAMLTSVISSATSATQGTAPKVSLYKPSANSDIRMYTHDVDEL